MENIDTINSEGTEYGIEASAVKPIAEIALQSGSMAGSVSINSKGNVSVESLSKHVNIEAQQSIQLKPTTGKVIVDTGKKLKAEVFDGDNIAFMDGKSASDIPDANVVRVEANFDDISDYNDLIGATKPTFKDGQRSKKEGSDGYWSKVNLAARSWDIRCHNHGGVALQVAGQDSSGLENKIKFESSRAKAITETANFPADYMYEGGKGMEFGTFNNLHSSLFTGDYRFNKDGMVYAVTRQTPVMDGDKFDYPTQADDFKDVVNQSLGVTWEDIVKGILYLKSQNLI